MTQANEAKAPRLEPSSIVGDIDVGTLAWYSVGRAIREQEWGLPIPVWCAQVSVKLSTLLLRRDQDGRYALSKAIRCLTSSTKTASTHAWQVEWPFGRGVLSEQLVQPSNIIITRDTSMRSTLFPNEPFLSVCPLSNNSRKSWGNAAHWMLSLLGTSGIIVLLAKHANSPPGPRARPGPALL